MSEAIVDRTPREDGLAMPPEWARHRACLMAWPTLTRAPMWGELFEQAKRDYAEVAAAIKEYEPVVMLAHPDQADEAGRLLPGDVDVLPVPIDDSWMRDNGPIFVTDGKGGVALVQFRFNAWGGKFEPHDRDAQVPEAIAAHLGMRRYAAPFVLEGGSFLVDGEGTLLTTEQCLLNPNRNPSMGREQIEQGLRDYLGVDSIIWLGRGTHLDRDTDGHVDGIALFLRPGVVALSVPRDSTDPDHEAMMDNVRRLGSARDARGRTPQVVEFDPGFTPEVAYLNCYLANGAAIVPVGDHPGEETAIDQMRSLFPDREIVAVPGRTLEAGGGGPHCITQQVPEGKPLR